AEYGPRPWRAGAISHPGPRRRPGKISSPGGIRQIGHPTDAAHAAPSVSSWLEGPTIRGETRAIVNIRHAFGRVTAMMAAATGVAALALTGAGAASASTAHVAGPASTARVA